MAATTHGGTITAELRRLDPATLRELAALAESHKPTLWTRLTPEAKEEGLAMLVDDRRPSIAWWEAHIPKALVDRSVWPATPPASSGYRTRPWQPWELTAAAVDMAEDRVPVDVAHDVLATLAAAHGLTDTELADAYLAFEDTAE